MTKNELVASSMLASSRRTLIPFVQLSACGDSWVRDMFLRDEAEAAGAFTGLNVQFAASEAGDETSIWVVKWGDDAITQL